MSAPDVMTMSQTYSPYTPQIYNAQQYLHQKLNFGANGYQIHGESLSPQEDLSQVQPISGNILPISLPLDQAQHNQSLESIAKLEPSQIALENKIHEKTFGGKNTEELLEEIFEEALSETKPRAREMRSYPSSFYQQQPTSPQRGSSGFGSISGSPMGYSSFPTYAPSVFPTHQTATTSPLATTNNGDQSLWASQAYASAYAQQFQQNHPAYAGSVQNAHLYNAPLTHLAASPASAYNQSSLFPTSHVPSASGILSGHQDQQASFSAGFRGY